jgi:hypothetical protein
MLNSAPVDLFSRMLVGWGRDEVRTERISTLAMIRSPKANRDKIIGSARPDRLWQFVQPVSFTLSL